MQHATCDKLLLLSHDCSVPTRERGRYTVGIPNGDVFCTENALTCEWRRGDGQMQELKPQPKWNTVVKTLIQ